MKNNVDYQIIESILNYNPTDECDNAMARTIRMTLNQIESKMPPHTWRIKYGYYSEPKGVGYLNVVAKTIDEAVSKFEKHFDCEMERACNPHEYCHHLYSVDEVFEENVK